MFTVSVMYDFGDDSFMEDCCYRAADKADAWHYATRVMQRAMLKSKMRLNIEISDKDGNVLWCRSIIIAEPC